MRRPIRFLLFIIGSVFSCYAEAQERSVDYVLGNADRVIENSQYNLFSVIDTRDDTTQLGFTLTGAFNRLALVVPETDIKQQLSEFFSSAVNPSNAAKGELIVQIREWQFSESSKRTTEFGFCNLRLSFYANKTDNYFLLGTLTKRVSVSKMDVSKAIKEAVKEQLNIYVGTILKATAGFGIPYSYNQLKKIEQYEKDEVPIYSGAEWVDGLYLNFNSFKTQKPDLKIEVRLLDEKISKVNFYDKQGRLRKWSGKPHYAIVYDGKPFIYTETGYYPIKRVDRDFQFAGLMPSVGNASSISFGIMFGLVGVFITPTAREWYLVEIDHLDGNFNYKRYANHQD